MRALFQSKTLHTVTHSTLSTALVTTSHLHPSPLTLPSQCHLKDVDPSSSISFRSPRCQPSHQFPCVPKCLSSGCVQCGNLSCFVCCLDGPLFHHFHSFLGTFRVMFLCFSSHCELPFTQFTTVVQVNLSSDVGLSPLFFIFHPPSGKSLSPSSEVHPVHRHSLCFPVPPPRLHISKRTPSAITHAPEPTVLRLPSLWPSTFDRPQKQTLALSSKASPIDCL